MLFLIGGLDRETEHDAYMVVDEEGHLVASSTEPHALHQVLEATPGGPWAVVFGSNLEASVLVPREVFIAIRAAALVDRMERRQKPGSRRKGRSPLSRDQDLPA